MVTTYAHTTHADFNFVIFVHTVDGEAVPLHEVLLHLVKVDVWVVILGILLLGETLVVILVATSVESVDVAVESVVSGAEEHTNERAGVLIAVDVDLEEN